VGCGLIGGSLAKKIHAIHPSLSILGVSSKAAELKADPNASCFSSVVSRVEALPKDIDLAIVAVPIEHTASTMKAVSAHVQEQCIITDVASTKATIQKDLATEGIKQPVIFGHPMAGKESTGFDVSEASLFDNAAYFLIKDQSDAYQALKHFLESLSMRVVECNASEHDELVSIVSHMPYLMASLCISLVEQKSDESKAIIKQSYGPGFRDTTRVAGSSPEWGRAVCEENKANILKHIKLIMQQLESLHDSIENNEFQTIETRLKALQSQKLALNN